MFNAVELEASLLTIADGARNTLSRLRSNHQPWLKANTYRVCNSSQLKIPPNTNANHEVSQNSSQTSSQHLPTRPAASKSAAFPDGLG